MHSHFCLGESCYDKISLFLFLYSLFLYSLLYISAHLVSLHSPCSPHWSFCSEFLCFILSKELKCLSCIRHVYTAVVLTWSTFFCSVCIFRSSLMSLFQILFVLVHRSLPGCDAVLLKHLYLAPSPHSVTTQKPTMDICTAPILFIS
jgi:hypothetical protein